MKSYILAGVLTTGVAAQSGPWQQCGGIGWQGSTTCVSGYHCQYYNEWYSQCIPSQGSTTLRTSTTQVAPTSTISSAPATTTTSSPGGGSKKFKWFGVNQSCAEFGKGIFPGRWGTEFIFPSTSSISTLIRDGMNTFRVAFSMERLVPNTLTSAFDQGYLKNLTETVNYITNNGAWAVLDPHNFGRYYDNIITDVTAFKTFWYNVAKVYANNPRVIFDTNNEYHDMDQNLVFQLNQAAIDGIRSAGATQQYIFVEGNSWTGAWTWNVTNTNLAALADPENKIIYEMHQYLDSDGSGTSEACVSTEAGVQRVIGATRWLRENGKLGILGEFAGGANPTCRTAITGLLDHLRENSDVWTGALWWAAGPCEPPSGTAYTYYIDLLRQYA
ncbi:endoglucanase-like protein [Thermochaetoides thermophila DSM 1495]|uniref:cellulase n=1 Tax=Chaetomium thermophilum (strain DSM 1495 / CBS 144.50 / IMI 039719) TaxID=759272 RepID=G0SC45_CHATD|nr:endoglucanase-like protein [Thermochaetoides thermophila DSM 1495]EGS18971.1 endoglucanase-like protein [Thermochaetoides thermophila DSM 1495]